jgi:hypothetical protein
VPFTHPSTHLPIRSATYSYRLLLATSTFRQRLRIGNFGEFWEEEWLSHPLLQTLLAFSYIYASEEGSARIEGIEDMEALLGLRASRQPRAE